MVYLSHHKHLIICFMNTNYRLIIIIGFLFIFFLNSCQFGKTESLESLDTFIKNTPSITRADTCYFVLIGSVGCNSCIKDIVSNTVRKLKNKPNLYIILSPKLKKITLKYDSTFIPNRYFERTEFVDNDEKLSYLNLVKYHDMRISSIEKVDYLKFDSTINYLSNL